MNYINNPNVKERLPGSSFISHFMRKFLIFIGFLFLLILSEYFLVTELFGQKRPLVLIISLMSSIIFIIAAYRFFKKNFLTSKQV